MSWMGSMPRSTRALEIPMTSCDSHSASVVRSPLIPSTCAVVSSNSADKSRPSGGCRPRAYSSVSIASCTSRSASSRQRRIQHSSNDRLRSVSRLDRKLEVSDREEKSYPTASAQA
jgi:hypothetical protein